MSEREFEAIVMGAGPVGEVCAGRLADGGLKVALIECHLVGGECSFYACMPSKALLRPAEILAEVKRVGGAREAIRNDVDVPATLKRRDEVIHDRDDSGQLPWLEEKGIELVRGEAKLDGQKRVLVGDDVLVASRAVVVATGTGAAHPPIPGLDGVGAWTNREVTTTEDVPESLVILGGGPVGAEMAQAYISFGSNVTLIEGEDRIMPREEPFASEQVTDSLREQGVDVRTGVKAEEVERDGDRIKVTLEGGDTVDGAQLLVAVGRKPRTDDIGLDTVGLEPGKSIEVGDDMRVPGKDWLYAIGDVNGRALLTHMGKYQGRIAGDVILGKGAKVVETASPPRVTFTDPEVAAVGHTLDSAKEAGIKARAVDVETSGNAGGSFRGRETAGTSRIVVDEDRGVIVGATMVGTEIAESLHAATIAVVGEVPMDRLWHAIPSFPTRSELWLKLMEAYGL